MIRLKLGQNHQKLQNLGFTWFKHGFFCKGKI